MTPLGVGIDVVELTRFGRLVERRGSTFTDRWFSNREVAESTRASSFAAALATRFAIKEAVWKSLGIGSRADPLPWRTIEVTRGESNEWRVSLDGIAARHARTVAADAFVCSASASEGVAIAIAYAYRNR